MNSRIIWASTLHRRFSPVTNQFEYHVPYFLVELSDLESLAHSHRWFSINRFNLFSIHFKDYLQVGPESIAEKLALVRQRLGLDRPHQTLLLTFPRFLGLGFNPISLYFSVNIAGEIEGAIVEVTNTYHEKHVYWVSGSAGGRNIKCNQPKEFHVSPFLPNDGQYSFSIGRQLDAIDIHIEYLRDTHVVLYANLIQKETFLMTDRSMLKTAMRYPFGIVATMPRILKEAAKLVYFKKMAAAGRPIPHHQDTIRGLPPSRLDSFWIAIVRRILGKITIGQLTIGLPDGSRITFGSDSECQGVIQVNHYSVFKTLVLKGEVGLGEAYVNGYWDTPSLLTTMTVLIRNKSALSASEKGAILVKLLGRAGHFSRRNTVTNSSANIRAHYDLSNELYSLFLDKGMNYSSAFFESVDDSLELAQEQKLDRLISGLMLKPHHHVLEIGSGWGSAAIKIARDKKCKVTTLTLSQAQFQVVAAKIQKEGLSDQVTVLLQDYRNHTGQYDRILSIEMIEAVGDAYLSTYFKTLDRLLKPNGIIALQAITIPDQRYDRYRRRVDWIQKYIFPGGHLPSVATIQKILVSDTSLMIESLENIGPHYAKTLATWRARFLSNEQKIRNLGFDTQFIRKWVYYLSYCEAGFVNRYINTVQLILTRPVNMDLIAEDIR